MSVQAISWVIEHSKHKASPFVLLLVLANHAHSDGTGAYPSLDTIARESRITTRHVCRLIKILCQSGELMVEKYASPYGSNLYSFPKMSEGDNRRQQMSESDNLSTDKRWQQMSPESSLKVLKNKRTELKGIPQFKEDETKTLRCTICNGVVTHSPASQKHHVCRRRSA